MQRVRPKDKHTAGALEWESPVQEEGQLSSIQIFPRSVFDVNVNSMKIRLKE